MRKANAGLTWKRMAGRERGFGPMLFSPSPFCRAICRVEQALAKRALMQAIGCLRDEIDTSLS